MSRDNIDQKLDKALRCLYCIEAGLLLLALIVAL
jgi:hypothetical protein